MSSGDGRETAAEGDWAEVLVVMDRTLRSFSDVARPILASCGAADLSPANALFLLSIGCSDRTVADVVRSGRYLSSNASYIIKTLQESGFLDRRADERDRRAAIVSLTDRGLSVASALRRACSAPGAGEALKAIKTFEDLHSGQDL